VGTAGMIRGSPRLPGALHIMRPYNEISATSRYSDKDIKDIGRGQEQGQCHERRGGGAGADINTKITTHIHGRISFYSNLPPAYCGDLCRINSGCQSLSTCTNH